MAQSFIYSYFPCKPSIELNWSHNGRAVWLLYTLLPNGDDDGRTTNARYGNTTTYGRGTSLFAKNGFKIAVTDFDDVTFERETVLVNVRFDASSNVESISVLND